MILLTLSVIATIISVIALAVQRRWVFALTGSVVWLLIVYILIFYSTAVTRSVSRAAPVRGEEGEFYLAIQMLNRAMFDSYFAVIYLSLLLLIVSIWRRSDGGFSKRSP